MRRRMMGGIANKAAVRMIELPEQNLPLVRAHVPATARLDAQATASNDHSLDAVISTTEIVFSHSSKRASSRWAKAFN